MADYTLEMFREDYDIAIPILSKYRNLETLDKKDTETQQGNAVMDIMTHFVSKYGNARGVDYEMRFLSVMQFIEHYQSDLLKLELISGEPGNITNFRVELLETLLDSIRSPQSPSPYPSSPLYNQNREFNYKKVLKAVKLINKD